MDSATMQVNPGTNTIGIVVGTAIGVTIGALLMATVLLLTSKLGLGLKVDGFGSAFTAALVISVVRFLVSYLIRLSGVQLDFSGLLGRLVDLILSAVILMISDRILPGLRVGGFSNAIFATLGISAVLWGLDLLFRYLAFNA